MKKLIIPFIIGLSACSSDPSVLLCITALGNVQVSPNAPTVELNKNSVSFELDGVKYKLARSQCIEITTPKNK